MPLPPAAYQTCLRADRTHIEKEAYNSEGMGAEGRADLQKPGAPVSGGASPSSSAVLSLVTLHTLTPDDVPATIVRTGRPELLAATSSAS